LEQGREAGKAAGLEEGRMQATQEAAQLRQLAHNFSAELSGANDKVAQSMLELALDLSKAMLKHALSVRPELVLPVVAEAIRYLPTLQQPAMLFLHPQDAQLVQHQMQPELDKAGWRIVEDRHVSRGGCRIETGSNQIDATAETRWQRIANALGKHSDWMAE
jgi:flagellar assembly protein FliH